MTSDDFKSFTKQILQDEDPLPSRPLSLYPSISLCCGLDPKVSLIHIVHLIRRITYKARDKRGE